MFFARQLRWFVCYLLNLSVNGSTRVRLPHFAEHFPTKILLAGFTIAHNTTTRAQDLNAKSIKDGAQILRFGVNPLARLADTFHVPYHLLSTGTILQFDSKMVPG